MANLNYWTTVAYISYDIKCNNEPYDLFLLIIQLPKLNKNIGEEGWERDTHRFTLCTGANPLRVRTL